MNDLQVFTYNQSEIRTVAQENGLWWVLADVCKVLEIKNPTDVANRLDDDEVTRFNLGGLSGEVNIINEPGLYNVILRSDKPQAKDFKRWVTHDVIPSIRKNGYYAALHPICIEDVMIQSLQEMKQVKAQLATVSNKVNNICDVVALSSNLWREDTRRLLAKIAQSRGGGGAYQEVNAEVFHLVDERAGVSLATRLTNKRYRMSEEGVCKSKRDKLTKVDIIADDKKLIEIYLAVVKEMAIKYDIAQKTA